MSQETLWNDLKAEFVPPLSPTLVTTILFDFDPTPESLPAIRSTLQSLADTAAAESHSLLSPSFNYPTSSEEEEVQRALEEWSLSSSTNGGGASAWSDSTGATSMTESWVEERAFEEESTPIEFLTMLFPHSSQASLQQALDQDPAADISQVVESLLSIEAIREAEEMGHWDEDSGESEEDEGPTRAQAIAAWKGLSQEEKDQAWVGGQKPAVASVSHPKKKKKKKDEATTTVHVNSLPTSYRSHIVPASSSTAPFTPSSASANPWATFSSIASTLSTLLPPTEPAYFLSYLHYPNYDTPHSALLASLTSLANELSPLAESGPDAEGPDMMLEILFAGMEDPVVWMKSQAEVELVWKATHGKMDAALDVWSLLQDVKSWNQQLVDDESAIRAQASASNSRPSSPTGSPKPVHVAPQKALYAGHAKQNSTSTSPSLAHLSLPPSSPVIAHSPLAPSSPTPSHARPTPLSTTTTISSSLYPTSSSTSSPPRKPNAQPLAQKRHNDARKWNPSKPVKAPKGPLHPLAESIPAYRKMGPGALGAARWEDLRMSEEKERAARNEMLRKATRMYQSGNAGNRGGEVAGYYAAEARKLADSTRSIALSAAKAKLVQQSKITLYSVDLHGLTAYQGLSVVSEGVHTWWATAPRSAGETKAPERPFTIITGQGIHSPGQRSVLQPAVIKMLEGEGWRCSKSALGVVTVLTRV